MAVHFSTITFVSAGQCLSQQSQNQLALHDHWLLFSGMKIAYRLHTPHISGQHWGTAQ